ncbi:pseudouridine synthase [Billgrantia endophytica]|uniref:Ribosomal small subunit pseudouridine synthase A n=1 Tax=Billgrantia endophytica TaxID=2033802 RepID=A0A2N7UAM8_9GAMM|nr:pseudouridine synthase [Halomonas endophytica]PMR77455.1 16S rRNA pseudouridine(516) synthase [Halomonas endophytica]
MRLDRFLSETTDLTRSLAKKALHRGDVTVNGEVIKQSAHQVSGGDRILWEGQPLELVGLRYVMLNKPGGVECSSRRGLYPLVGDLIELPRAERLRTVGRLDVDTTGMVLLTDDGQWSHRVTSPRKRCGKVYRVTLGETLEGDALREAMARFHEGLALAGEEKLTMPADLTMRSPTEAELTLYEGKYHQVKRMFAAIGNAVVALHRESIGPLVLGDLAEGQWRELSDDEVAMF